VPIDETQASLLETKALLASVLAGQCSAETEQLVQGALKPEEALILKEVRETRAITAEILPCRAQVGVGFILFFSFRFRFRCVYPHPHCLSSLLIL
jgi:hypothetical protein